MVILNEEQIHAVVEWMGIWDQLKDSSIPIRFKEDWMDRFKMTIDETNYVKPPLGLKPKWIHDKQRQGEIMEAIARYMAAGMEPPKEWALEFASYCK